MKFPYGGNEKKQNKGCESMIELDQIKYNLPGEAEKLGEMGESL